MKYRTPCSIFSRLFISDRKCTLILNKVKLNKRKNNFFYNAALKWNQVVRLLIIPYIIIIQPHTLSRDTIINDNSHTLNYDLTLSVSTFKNKLKEIIYTVQSHGVDSEWCMANSMLTTYSNSSRPIVNQTDYSYN